MKRNPRNPRLLHYSSVIPRPSYIFLRPKCSSPDPQIPSLLKLQLRDRVQEGSRSVGPHTFDMSYISWMAIAVRPFAGFPKCFLAALACLNDGHLYCALFEVPTLGGDCSLVVSTCLQLQYLNTLCHPLFDTEGSYNLAGIYGAEFCAQKICHNWHIRV